ncbi:MAG: hypothetical protein Q8Q09_02545 [Deltaproteobacteria bacterium]|nr:hypothetical protein [Deltaproteobacteria bacterium]
MVVTRSFVWASVISVASSTAIAQVTFTAGPMPTLAGVTFTPDPVARPSAPSVQAAPSAQPSRAAHQRERAPERRVPEALPTREPATSPPEPVVTPSGSPATSPGSCRLARGIETVALDEHARDGVDRAMSLSLASYEDEVFALVMHGRVGSPRAREGVVFSRSSLVRVRSGEHAHTVVSAPGFEPGAALALGPEQRLYVVSPTHVDVRHSSERAQWTVSVLDTAGHVTQGPQVLAASAGAVLDAPPVAWRGGLAVVLGEVRTRGAERVIVGVTERVYSLDTQGSARRAPWVLTDGQRPESLGRFRVGLGRVSGGDSLAAVFGEADALWTRRFTDGPSAERAQRVAGTGVWGPEVANDGGSIVVREGGLDGSPVRLRAMRWDGGLALDLGHGWEPLAVLHRDRVLVAGALTNMADGRRVTALWTEAQRGAQAHAIEAPHGAHQRLDDAVDVSVAPTRDGAVLAWIEATDRMEGQGPRQLAIARVRCE